MRPILAQREAHWEDMRGERLAPKRSEISPQFLQGSLAHVFVLERISPGLARFRLARSHLTDLLEQEMHCHPASAFSSQPRAKKLSDAMQFDFDDPPVVGMELGAAKGFGRAVLTGDMVIMPLRSDLGEISRALGVVMSGDIGRSARKLRITGQCRCGLVGFADHDVTQFRRASETDDQNRIQCTPLASFAEKPDALYPSKCTASPKKRANICALSPTTRFFHQK